MKKVFTLICILLIAVKFIAAQSFQIRGVVRDADSKDPIGGANVKIEKSRAVTDESGKFTINIAAAGEYTMATSVIGYKTDKRQITLPGDVMNIEILLKPSSIQISTVETVSQFKKNTARETVSTQVIGVDQIEKTNAIDLGEVIAKSPGVLVQDGQITIRSANSYSYGVGSRTAVLEDGLPLMSPDLGEAQINMAGLSNVKQVEIVKGASSVVYGSGALNGVVNLISSWPTDNDPKTDFSINSSFSDHPNLLYQKWWGQATPWTLTYNVNHQRRIKNFQIVAAGNLTQIKSYLQTNAQFRMEALFKLRYLHPKIEGLNFGLNGAIQYEKSERFFISKDLDTGVLEIQKGSGDQYIRTRIDPFLSYHSSKGHRLTINTRYLNIFRNGNGTDPNAISHLAIVYDQYQYNWKNMLIFTTGAPFDVAYSASNLYTGNIVTFHAAAYAQLEFDYKFLSVQGGVRYEASGVDTVIIKNFPPIFRAGLNAQAAKGTFFRASWGQGYRIPVVGEKYIAQQFTGDIVIIPNDTLRAERSWNLELGFWQGFKIGNWKGFFDASFFWQQSRNFIEYHIDFYPNKYRNGTDIFPDSLEVIPGSLLGIKPLNIENTRVAGYELALEGMGNIGPIGIKLLAGYTYTWPGQQPPPDSVGLPKYSIGQFIKDMFTYNFKKVEPVNNYKILEDRIRHLVRADVELSYWKAYLGCTITYGSNPEKITPLFNTASLFLFHDGQALQHYSDRHSKGDYTVDIRAGVQVDKHVRFGFIVKNVTNRLYELRPGRAEPLRSYTFQFKYIF